MKNFVLFIALMSLLFATGCSSTLISAAQNASMSVDTKMSTPVFMTPAQTSQKIVVHITNTCGAKLDIDHAIEQTIQNNGHIITDDALAADIVVLGDMRHFGKPIYVNPMIPAMENIQSMNSNIQIASGLSGVAKLSSMGGLGGSGMAGLGMGVNALSGLATAGMQEALEVVELAGVIDLQITEKASGKVTATQIVVTVRQTNLNEDDALTALEAAVAEKLAELFRQS